MIERLKCGTAAMGLPEQSERGMLSTVATTALFAVVPFCYGPFEAESARAFSGCIGSKGSISIASLGSPDDVPPMR